MEKFKQRHTVFAVPIAGVMREVQPVNGALMYAAEAGFERGVVHFAAPQYAECLGFSSLEWFEQNAVEVLDPAYRMQKYLCRDLLFVFPIAQKDKRRKGIPTLVRPVDGEKDFNHVSHSHGFTHFAHPTTGVCLGFCGQHYFENHAVEHDPNKPTTSKRQRTR